MATYDRERMAGHAGRVGVYSYHTLTAGIQMHTLSNVSLTPLEISVFLLYSMIIVKYI